MLDKNIINFAIELRRKPLTDLSLDELKARRVLVLAEIESTEILGSALAGIDDKNAGYSESEIEIFFAAHNEGERGLKSLEDDLVIIDGLIATQEKKSQPKELHDQAVQKESDGDEKGAATLYEEAGYAHKAIQIYVKLGEIQAAYELAKRSGDDWTANNLASEHKIPGHEFTQFPSGKGRDIIEVMAEALASRLQRGATAERLGFSGFEGKVVADIGTRDGRFVPMFRALGASDVYGIDPNEAELQKAIDAGTLDEAHAIPKKIEDIPPELKGKLEVASIFNFNVPIDAREDFIRAVYESLTDDGQLVMTIAEDDIARDVRPILEKYFVIRSEVLWKGSEDHFHGSLRDQQDARQDIPHKNLVIGLKRPQILVKD